MQNKKKNPLVSVYWITIYRSEYVLKSINSFLNSTNYDNLEIIIIDCSVGNNGKNHRKRIKESKTYDKVFFRKKIYCVSNNANLAFLKCSGDYIIHLEDDVIFKNNLQKNWLYKFIQDMINNNIDIINLFSSSVIPCTVGHLSTRKAREKLHPHECYPYNFKTITESMRSADTKKKIKFKKSNLKIKSNLILKTFMNAPSINFSKLPRLLGKKNKITNYKFYDDLIYNGETIRRDKKISAIDYNKYKSIGGWKNNNWEIKSLDKESFKVSYIKIRLLLLRQNNLLRKFFKSIV